MEDTHEGGLKSHDGGRIYRRTKVDTWRRVEEDTHYGEDTYRRE